MKSHNKYKRKIIVRLTQICLVSALYVGLLEHFSQKFIFKNMDQKSSFMMKSTFEKPEIHPQSSDQNTQGIVYKVEKYSGFTAYILEVSNPKRVHVVLTPYKGKVGETVSQFVNRFNAVAGINGGSFTDPNNWRGTGGLPDGIVLSYGKLVNRGASKSQPIIGFTQSGKLIAGTYSLSQLKGLHVTEALSFGPVLVKNGVNVVQGNGGWGYAPRTVVGQTANGTVLLVVTSGRYENGINNVGASLSDMANVLIQNGAVLGANLDGGSSATMILQGKLMNTPTDILGERKIATALVVN